MGRFANGIWQIQNGYNRFRRWVKSGLWQRLFEALIDRILKAGEIDFELWCVDGTVVRAHRVASGAPKTDETAKENAEKHALVRQRHFIGVSTHLRETEALSELQKKLGRSLGLPL